MWNLAGLVYIVLTDLAQIPVEPMHDLVQIAVGLTNTLFHFLLFVYHLVSALHPYQP
jgi:hypothetical protein